MHQSTDAPFLFDPMPVATIKDIIDIVEEMAPSAWAEKWDNSGLQVGSVKQSVDKVFMAVDVTTSVLNRAIKAKAQLLITHHPLLFHPLRQLSLETPTGKIISRAIEKSITIYSAHTNLDIVSGGVNTALIKELGLKDTKILKETEIPSPDQAVYAGYGYVGILNRPVTFKQFIPKIKRGLALSYLQMAGKAPAKVHKIAVCGGSGSELMEEAYKTGADIYITAELKHSHARMAEEINFCVLDIGHFHSEKFGIKSLAKFIRKRLNDRGLGVSVIEDKEEKSPLQLV